MITIEVENWDSHATVTALADLSALAEQAGGPTPDYALAANELAGLLARTYAALWALLAASVCQSCRSAGYTQRWALAPAIGDDGGRTEQWAPTGSTTDCGIELTAELDDPEYGTLALSVNVPAPDADWWAGQVTATLGAITTAAPLPGVADPPPSAVRAMADDTAAKRERAERIERERQERAERVKAEEERAATMDHAHLTTVVAAGIQDPDNPEAVESYRAAKRDLDWLEAAPHRMAVVRVAQRQAEEERAATMDLALLEGMVAAADSRKDPFDPFDDADDRTRQARKDLAWLKAGPHRLAAARAAQGVS